MSFFTKKAIYLPAVYQFFAEKVITNITSTNGIFATDLNFLDVHNTFYYPDALYSAGCANLSSNALPTMFDTRTKTNRLLGDSGGYEIASGNLVPTNENIHKIHNFLNTKCCAAMTLDVPTKPMYRQKLGLLPKSYPYNTFDDCLFETIRFLEHFKDLGSEKGKFLNVLQGSGINDTDKWYDNVKPYKLYGWAFAGGIEYEFHTVLYRILRLIKDNQFDKPSTWLHFLGVSTPMAAVFLSTIKSALNMRFQNNCEIEVSYDSRTPFLHATNLEFFKEKSAQAPFLLTTEKVVKSIWCDDPSDFPTQASSISKRMKKNDIVFSGWKKQADTNNMSYLLLMNHNTEAMINSFAYAHDWIEKKQSINGTASTSSLNIVYDILLEKDIKKAFHKLMYSNLKEILQNMK